MVLEPYHEIRQNRPVVLQRQLLFCLTQRLYFRLHRSTNNLCFTASLLCMDLQLRAQRRDARCRVPTGVQLQVKNFGFPTKPTPAGVAGCNNNNDNKALLIHGNNIS